mmetsp:Transcript_31274/g.54324  ORF Transcript_31274/g.54324 Transcript_31274/m.54324 type:complete len:130 (+) Transcript_31274:2-391(+)
MLKVGGGIEGGGDDAGIVAIGDRAWEVGEVTTTGTEAGDALVVGRLMTPIVWTGLKVGRWTTDGTSFAGDLDLDLDLAFTIDIGTNGVGVDFMGAIGALGSAFTGLPANSRPLRTERACSPSSAFGNST